MSCSPGKSVLAHPSLSPASIVWQLALHVGPLNLFLSTADLASPTDSNAEPASSNQSHKDSENSWLSCESSVELEGHVAPSPPLPEKDLVTVQSAQSSNADIEAQKSQEDIQTRRFTMSPRMISDAIIGVSDGMTVPFALTAGLASLGDTKLVVLGGLAELIAGAISMGLGGFIGAKSEA